MKLKYRIWLSSDDDERVFGYGLYHLLRYIKLFGSINKACNAMNLPYAKASTIINRCENYFKKEVIIRSAGGINGGGSEVSDFGLELMGQYDSFLEQSDLELRKLYNKHLEVLNDFKD